MKSRILRAIALLEIVALLAACGLATSNADRLERAQTEIQTGNYRAAMIELKNILGADTEHVEARLLLAKVSLGLGDVLAAEKELARAAALGANDAQVQPLHLKILAAKGKFADVLAFLGMDTGGLTDEQQLKFRGDALLAIGNAPAALATYQEWSRLDPESVEAAVGVANASAANGELQAATGMLESLADSQPDNVDAWRSLGALRIHAQEYESAEAAFANAARHSRPQQDTLGYISILAALTEIQLGLNKKDAARMNLEGLAGIAPNAPVTLLLAARLARADGDFDLAARHLQTLLRVSPENTQAMLILAHVQSVRGNVEQAAQLLNRVIALSPDNIEARKLLARIQLTQAQPGGAIETLGHLLVNESSDAEAYRLLAHASLQQGDTDSAIDRFRSAAALAPDSVEHKLDLAASHLAARDESRALEILEALPEGAGRDYRREQLLMLALGVAGRLGEADDVAERLMQNPADPSTAVNMVADHYTRTDRLDKAERTLREYLGRSKSDVGALAALARIELAKNNPEGAERLLAEVRTLDPDNEFALLGMARIAELSGNESRKMELLEAAVEARDDAVVPRAWLAASYLAVERKRDAEVLVNEVIEIGFSNAQISEIVGNVLMELGRGQDAIVHLEDAARVDPASSRLQLDLARAYLSQNRSVDAKDALQTALRIRPNWLPAMSILTLVELRQGDTASANRLVRVLRAAYPEDVGPMLLEGEALMYQQDFPAAAAAFRRAAVSGGGRNAVLKEYRASVAGKLPDPERVLIVWLSRSPDDSIARYALAQHYQRVADNDRAIQQYEQVLTKEPENVAVLNNLAWLHQQEKRLDVALELAQKAYALGRSIGSVADTLGWIYRDLGQLDKSLELLSQASQLSPDNGEISFHLALVMSEKGKVGAARDILQDLIDGGARFPSRRQAEQLLTQL